MDGPAATAAAGKAPGAPSRSVGTHGGRIGQVFPHTIMIDLATALALVLVVEGTLWALFPEGMKQAAARAAFLDNGALRVGGLLFVGLGVLLVWLIRG